MVTAYDQIAITQSVGGSSPSRWGGFDWYDSVRDAFKLDDGRSIPESIWGSIIGVESSGKTDAVGDFIDVDGVKLPTSFGLFQIHTRGGLGDAYKDTPESLYDPALNAHIAANAIKPAYLEGLDRGLGGYDLVEYVASRSGFPLMTGRMPDYYRDRLQTSYQSQTSEQVGESAGVSRGQSSGAKLGVSLADNPLFRVLKTIETRETAEISLLKPAESTFKIVMGILFGVLGLILVGIGLVAFVGSSEASTIVGAIGSPETAIAQAAVQRVGK